MKKAIIIIIALLVVAGGTFAGLFFFTDIFNFMKPANENFSVQAKKLFGGNTTKKEASYKDYLASIEPLKGQDKSFTANAELSMNVSLPSSAIPYSTQSLINKTSVKLGSSYDKDSKAKAIDVGILCDGSDIVNLQAAVDGKKIGIASKDLYDKTLVFDMDKFIGFCKANNLEIDEETVKESIKAYEDAMKNTDKNSQLLYDLFYLTEDEYKALDKNYGDLLVSLIDEDKYESKKNQKISVNGDEVKTTAYTLTLSSKDVYNYIHKLAERAKDDSNISDIIMKKYDLIIKYVKENIGEEQLNNVDIPELKKSDIEKVMSELIKAIESSEDDFSKIKYSLKFTIYADKKQNPVRFDIALAKNSDDEGTVFFTEEVGNGKNTYTINIKDLLKKLGLSEDKKSDNDYSSYSSLSSSRNPVSAMASLVEKVVIVDKYESTDNSRKGTLTFSAKISGQNQDLLTVDYENVNSKSEIKNKLKVSSPLNISVDIDMEATGLDSDNQNFVCNVSGKYSSYEVGVKSKASINYGKSNIPSLSGSDSFDVFDKKLEELVPEISKILENAADKLPSRLSKYGINVSKSDILSAKSALDALTTPVTPDENGTTEEEIVPATEEPAA